jgi:hypothetical protein
LTHYRGGPPFRRDSKYVVVHPRIGRIDSSHVVKLEFECREGGNEDRVIKWGKGTVEEVKGDWDQWN